MFEDINALNIKMGHKGQQNLFSNSDSKEEQAINTLQWIDGTRKKSSFQKRCPL